MFIYLASFQCYPLHLVFLFFTNAPCQRVKQICAAVNKTCSQYVKVDVVLRHFNRSTSSGLSFQFRSMLNLQPGMWVWGRKPKDYRGLHVCRRLFSRCSSITLCEINDNANLSPADLELGLSLAVKQVRSKKFPNLSVLMPLVRFFSDTEIKHIVN